MWVGPGVRLRPQKAPYQVVTLFTRGTYGLALIAAVEKKRDRNRQTGTQIDRERERERERE